MSDKKRGNLNDFKLSSYKLSLTMSPRSRSKLNLTILHYRYRTGQKHDMEVVTSYRGLRRRESVCVIICVHMYEH